MPQWIGDPDCPRGPGSSQGMAEEAALLSQLKEEPRDKHKTILPEGAFVKFCHSSTLEYKPTY